MSTKCSQSVLVTGASRGIGLAAAKALAEVGFAVALNGPEDDQELVDAVSEVASSGMPVIGVPGDVGDLSLHDAMLERAEAHIGPLSTLINNAGVSVFARGDVLDVSEQSYDRCQSVNAKAQFFLSQCWARRLLNRDRDDGRFYSLINVSSSNAVAVAETRAEYCVSKAASAMISQAYAARLGRENIAVYDIQPGIIETAMTAPVIEQYRHRIAEESLTLLPRSGLPDDVARCMVTLATGALPYTTGHTISVDAGMLVPRF